MKQCLILTGGRVDYPTASGFLKENQYDLIIAVDGGLAAARQLGIKPDYCVGDFDSVAEDVYVEFKKQEGIAWETHPPEKDQTDTELALSLAIREKAERIHLFGATGTRMDHTLAAIGLLMMPMEQGIECFSIDANNRITMINKGITLKKSELFGKYVSLIPYTEKVTGVTLTGFKYPLTDYTFVQGNGLGVSNEVIEEEAQIQLKSGKLLLIESQD